MKICVLATSYPRSPEDHASPFVHGLSKGVGQMGHEVLAVVPHEKGLTSRQVIDGVELRRFRYFWPTALEQVAYGYGIPDNVKHKFWAKVGLPFFVFFFALKSFSQSRHCDVIHAHWEISALIACWIGRIRRRPVVYTVHRLVARTPMMKALTRYLLEHVDMIHFNSSFTCEQAARFTPLLARHEVIYPSIDIDFFKKTSPTSAFRNQFNINKNQKLIVGVGRVIEKKGFEYLLEAFAALIKTPANAQDLRLIIGGGGPLLVDLQKRALELCGSGKVFFTDFLHPAEVRDLLNEADVFVMPSIEDSRGEVETLGVTCMEAMACGAPVVASRLGGLPDVVDDGTTGILVEPKNSQALATAIDQVLRDATLANKLRHAALEKVQREFSWNTAVEKTIACYQRFVSERRR